MKIKQLTTIAFILISLGDLSFAKTYEVEMRNKGSLGYMVFEPSFLSIEAGDTVTFRSLDYGHNAQTINYMIPKDAITFRGEKNKDITTILNIKGIYGIVCQPHFTMGMVMIIQVGNNSKLTEYKIPNTLPKYAKKRFKQILDIQADKHKLTNPS